MTAATNRAEADNGLCARTSSGGQGMIAENDPADQERARLDH